ncbi:hypothetical protein QEG73_09475 [Chitinophagaceae bacterium 26-R-25]|nr:hypothetical protein [Chitinophagaceae bacterium 26-R-25]
MKPDLINILSNSNKDIDNQQLMDYISGKLSEVEKHAIEEDTVDNDFMNDAMEGLQSLKDNKKINFFVDQINSDLHKRLDEKKARKNKRRLKEEPWIYMAVVIVLVLIVLAYVVMHNLPKTN